MSNAIKRFNPQILSSPEDLKIFFKGEKKIQRVLDTRIDLAHPHRLRDRWNVIWCIVTVPLNMIACVFFVVIYNSAFILKANGIGKKSLLHYVHHFSHANKAWIIHRYGKDFLVKAINAHKLTTSDFYLQEPIPLKAVKKLKKANSSNFPIRNKEIDFFNIYGNCRGMANWHLYLYVNTRHHFANPIEHIIAVSKQFERGASRQAALLQSLYEVPNSLFNLRFDDNNAKLQIASFASLNYDHAAIIKKIQALKPGAYGVGLYAHRINFYKIEDNLGNDLIFIFDCNEGLIQLTGPNKSEKALKFFLKYHSKKDPESQIYIQRALVPGE